MIVGILKENNYFDVIARNILSKTKNEEKQNKADRSH